MNWELVIVVGLARLVWGKSMLELASHLRVMRGKLLPSLGTWELGKVALGVVQMPS